MLIYGCFGATGEIYTFNDCKFFTIWESQLCAHGGNAGRQGVLLVVGYKFLHDTFLENAHQVSFNVDRTMTLLRSAWLSVTVH